MVFKGVFVYLLHIVMHPCFQIESVCVCVCVGGTLLDLLDSLGFYSVVCD